MEMSESKVYMVDDDDPQMQQACDRARKTFRYFWRELSWERRRIIPGLDLACVKAPFVDDPAASGPAGRPEQMWFGEIDFDGRIVTGMLINQPNWLKSVQEGDVVRVPLAGISDWMYVISGQAFGGHTVNLMRSRMSVAERKQHDAAWGLDFGDPSKIRVVPEPNKGGGFLKNWFGGRGPVSDEHPMSEAGAPKLKEQLAKMPGMLSSTDDRGWTILHSEALAGNLAVVQTLLEAGADRNARTNDGQTPLELAESLGWDKVAALLRTR
jgi:uncharacterized protein